MKSLNILITAGGTSEKIDEVRKMSNISTGRLGALIAEEFIKKAANVTYICGETAVIPKGINAQNVIKIDSVNELSDTLTDLFKRKHYDAVIHAMAVSDYRPVRNLDEKKISSDLDSLVIHMEKTPKIINTIKQLQPDTILVGFKLLVGVAEEELLNTAGELLLKNDCDFVLANDLEKIDGDNHEGFLISANKGCTRLHTKQEIASAIVHAIAPGRSEMKIGFIGAGKVAFTLGKYFCNRGLNVVGYYSPNSAEQAAQFTNTACFDSLSAIAQKSNLLFLTVPDSVIPQVWEQLKAVSDLRGKIVCHCSGAMTSQVFEGRGYSVHPCFAISSKTSSYKQMSQVFFTIEGEYEHLDKLKNLIEGIGNEVQVITAAQKVKYHTAACFMSNHIAALVHIGSNIFKECGFSESMIATMLDTLFVGHCERIAHNGVVKTLVGPVDRNDVSTVKNHMECLAGNKEHMQLYSLITRQLIEIAKQKHPDYDYREMEGLL
jgi:predicted short-subunit dehydrogenase-like oxidoreductase (DUF2520 family)